MSDEFTPWEDMKLALRQLETRQPGNVQIPASECDSLADLRMAVEQIKNEPKPQPDMVPWEKYQQRIMVAQETWRTLERFRRVTHWRERQRGKRRSYLAMRSER